MYISLKLNDKIRKSSVKFIDFLFKITQFYNL